MGNLDKLDKIKRDALSNLDKDKLSQYILYLTKKYYISYLTEDENSFDETIDDIFEVIELYEDDYSNLMGFIFYSLFINANGIVIKASSNKDFNLKNPFKFELKEDEDMDEDLSHDIKLIFNKDRIRERYNEKTINKAIE